MTPLMKKMTPLMMNLKQESLSDINNGKENLKKSTLRTCLEEEMVNSGELI